MTGVGVRLWDKNFNFVGGQSDVPSSAASAPRDGVLSVTVDGDGPLYAAARDALRGMSLADDDLFVTVDHAEGRAGAKVTQLSIEDRRCECGGKIRRTTIEGRRT